MGPVWFISHFWALNSPQEVMDSYGFTWFHGQPRRSENKSLVSELCNSACAPVSLYSVRTLLKLVLRRFLCFPFGGLCVSFCICVFQNATSEFQQFPTYNSQRNTHTTTSQFYNIIFETRNTTGEKSTYNCL